MISSGMPPIIPRADLFGNPEKTSAQISPDAKYLAYLAPDEGTLNVWVRSANAQDDRVLTRDRKRGIRNFFWAYDNKHLLYVQDLDGDENWHLWSADMETGVIRDLTPFLGVQAQVIEADPQYPDELLVGLNVRDPRLHDVFRLNIQSGALVEEIQNPGNVVGWLSDNHMLIRGAHCAMPDGGFQLLIRKDTESEWQPLITWGPDEEGYPYSFTEDGNGLYVGSSLSSNTVELRLIDLLTGQEKTIAGNPMVDMGDVLFHPVKHTLQAVGFNEDRLEWQCMDEAIKADMDFLLTAQDGELHIASRDLSDQKWVVLYTKDSSPAGYYLYDRSIKKLDFLFTTRPALAKQTLAVMRPVRITARDGLTLHAYLTLPPGLPEKNLPLVLNVHGGPWARDFWGYDAEAQWLANRGYAVLQVNYRGSTGFGKHFLHAGDREWGGKMHDDLIDSVNWSIQEGIADPHRVAIFGGSYGGYAALVGASFTPDVFACSVDIVGPSSIRTLINSIPPYWEPLKKVFTVRVGDAETEPEFLDSRSPLYKADQIKCPLLIAQGKNDPRVKQAESEQIVHALESRGKKVEYMLFEDEGHGFARPENRLKFYAAAEKFLQQYLGGRSEG
jgi:dipeptidyl aminopeptidase/acylaminoacyl peptidase